MRPDARMRLESVSKLWTATLLLRLAQQHRLSLDDTVERWLPGLLPAGRRITLRQLLNHTSGLIDTNDIIQHPTCTSARSRIRLSAPRSRRSTSEQAKDPGYEFSPRLWVEFAAALPLLLAARLRLPLLQHRLHRRGPRRRTGRQAAASRPCSAPRSSRRSIWPRQPTIRTRGSPAPTRTATGSPRTASSPTQPPGRFGLGANGGIVSDAADEARFLTSLMRGALLGPAQLAALKTAFRPQQLRARHRHRQEWMRRHRVRPQRRRRRVRDECLRLRKRRPGRRPASQRPNRRHSGDAIAFKAMNKLYCAA